MNISVVVTNTGDLSGSYKVNLKVDNAIIATKDVTLAGGAKQEVTFATIRDIAGTYAVNVDSLSAKFIVRAAPAKPSDVPPSAPVEPLAPTTPQPLVSLWLIIGVVAVGMVIGVVIWRMIARRRAS